MQKLNVLFLSSWYPNKLEPLNGSFVQRHAEAVATMHNVEILHAIGNKNQETEFVFDDQIINNIRTLVVYFRSSSNPLLNFFKKIKAYKKGFTVMQKPDLVHSNVLYYPMLFAVYLKKKYKIPFVISEHWSDFLELEHHNINFLRKKTTFLITNNANAILPVSNKLKEGMLKFGIKNDFHVVPNVINTDLFSTSHDEKDEKTFNFLHISSLVKMKNPKKILNAFLRLKKEGYLVKLTIAGAESEELLEIVTKYAAKEYVDLLLTISQQEVAALMKKSHCFVLFSDFETQGCVLLESLSTGLPVIAPKVGGIEELINPNLGILIEVGNEEKLYEAMKNMIETSKIFKKEILHEFVESNFSVPVVAKQLNDVYKKVLSKLA